METCTPTDLLEILHKALSQEGYAISVDRGALLHPESGFLMYPKFVESVNIREGVIRATTMMIVCHAEILPKGLFEYQHSVAASLAEALSQGFLQWAQLDLVPLLDSQYQHPKRCKTLEMTIPMDGTHLTRRIILGPISHAHVPLDNQSIKTPADVASRDSSDQDHSFCPCCLFTKSATAFNEQIRSTEYLGIRLLAARGGDAAPVADCRINGREHEPGRSALCTYAATWPSAKYEMRKQYIILQTVDKPKQSSQD